MALYQKFMSRAEDVADTFLRHSRHYLPHIARLFLIATYLDDGLRMWFQWDSQREYFDSTWSCGSVLATLFVLANMLCQIVGCFMVLLRKQVRVAVGMLFTVIVMQSIAYPEYLNVALLARNMALSGGLLLLLAEISGEAKTIFAGVPTVDTNKKQSYMQLVGRVLVVFMFMTLFSFELSVLRLVELVVGTVLMLSMVIGFKTKLAALALVAWLMALHILFIPYLFSSNAYFGDLVRYYFFQALSVVGGLLLVVALGPGGVSIDAHRKKL